MELEEMKIRWETMSAAMEQQKKLTDSLIIKMIRLRYRNSINHVFWAEAISSIGCFALAGYILFNIPQLDKDYLLACGIGAAAILIALPLFSISILQRLRSLNIQANSFKQSLQEYSKGRMRFLSFQKISFYLSALLMVLALPVMGKLIGRKDLFIEARLWMWYAVGFIFFCGAASWVFRKYKKATERAENILKELENDQ